MRLLATTVSVAVLLVPSASALSEELRHLLRLPRPLPNLAAVVGGSKNRTKRAFPVLTAKRPPSHRREQQYIDGVCTLCFGGGTPATLETGVIGGGTFIDMFGEGMPFSTCRGLEEDLTSVGLASDDEECLIYQKISYLYCGCPESPPMPPGGCGVCPESAAIPSSHFSKEVQDIDIDEDGSPDSLTCADAEMTLLFFSLLHGFLGDSDSWECEPRCWAYDSEREQVCESPNDGLGLSREDCEVTEGCFFEPCDGDCEFRCWAITTSDEDIETCEAPNDRAGLTQSECEAQASQCEWSEYCYDWGDDGDGSDDDDDNEYCEFSCWALTTSDEDYETCEAPNDDFGLAQAECETQTSQCEWSEFCVSDDWMGDDSCESVCMGNTEDDDSFCDGLSKVECKTNWQQCFYEPCNCEPECWGTAEFADIEFCELSNNGQGLNESACDMNSDRCWWRVCDEDIDFCDFCYAEDPDDDNLVDLCEVPNDGAGLNQTECEDATGQCYFDACGDRRNRKMESRRDHGMLSGHRHRARRVAHGKARKMKHRALEKLRRAKRASRDSKNLQVGHLVHERRYAQRRAQRNTRPWNDLALVKRNRAEMVLRRVQDEGMEPSSDDFCPLFQAIFSEACGCPTSLPKTCPICSPAGELFDPYSGFSLDQVANLDGDEMSCGSILSILEATATDSICDEAPLALEEIGCGKCAEMPATANGEPTDDSAQEPTAMTDGYSEEEGSSPAAMPTTEPVSAEELSSEPDGDDNTNGGETTRSAAVLKATISGYAFVLPFMATGIFAPDLLLHIFKAFN